MQAIFQKMPGGACVKTQHIKSGPKQYRILNVVFVMCNLKEKRVL